MTTGLADVSTGTFTDWPLELGRIEERHGLTFVYPVSGGFQLRDYRKIPGGNRIELWDGIAVVYPELDKRSSSLLRYFYQLLKETCPEEFVPFIGPMDMVVGRGTVFAPDLLLLPKSAGPPALVVDIRRDHRSHVWRTRLRGYAHAGVGAHWAIDPAALTLTVHELDCKGGEPVWRLMDDAPPPTDAKLPVRTLGPVPEADGPIQFTDDPKLLQRVIDRLKRLQEQVCCKNCKIS